VVAAIRFFTKVGVLEGVAPSGVVSLPTSIELVKLVGREWRWTKEGFKVLSGILVVWGKNGIGREWSKGDVDDFQVGRWGF